MIHTGNIDYEHTESYRQKQQRFKLLDYRQIEQYACNQYHYEILPTVSRKIRNQIIYTRTFPQVVKRLQYAFAHSVAK